MSLSLWTVLMGLPTAAAEEPTPITVSMTLPSQPDADPFGQPRDKYGLTTYGVRPEGVTDSVTTEAGGLTITCGVRNGRLDVKVAYNTFSYPARVPEQIGCIVGDLDVTVRITTRAPLYSDTSELQAGPEQPVEWRRRRRRSMGVKGFALPAETAWQPVDVAALKPNGKPWDGVTCTVTSTPQGPLLTVTVARPKVRDHSGTCPLPAGEQVVAVPFTVVTLD